MPNTAAFWFRPACRVAQPGDSIAEQFSEDLRSDITNGRAFFSGLGKELPRGVLVKVLADGAFLFQFSDWPPAASPKARVNDHLRSLDEAFDHVRSYLPRVELLNAYIACLHAALFRSKQSVVLPKMVVTLGDITWMESVDDHDGLLKLRGNRVPSPSGEPLVELDVPTLVESFRLLAELINQDADGAVRSVALYLRGSRALEEGANELCLSICWTVVERLLRKYWENYLDANRNRATDVSGTHFISNERRKQLAEGREYTASVVTEILSLLDEIPMSLYRELTVVRQARNAWIHGLKEVAYSDAFRSIQLLRNMLIAIFGVNLAFSFGAGRV